MTEGIWHSIVSHQETNTRETKHETLHSNYNDLSKHKTIETDGRNINHHMSGKQYRYLKKLKVKPLNTPQYTEKATLCSRSQEVFKVCFGEVLRQQFLSSVDYPLLHQSSDWLLGRVWGGVP